jgi:LacI family transcriptional regulator
MVTQTTIAEQLGLSQASVASVLGSYTGRRMLNPRLEAKVKRTATKLGYRPHRQAQLLCGVKSGLIGLIKATGVIQAGVERSFFASQAIQAAGYGLLVSELLWEEAGEHRAVDTMLDAHVEGVLLLGVTNLAELQRLSHAKIPSVAVHSVCLPGTPLVMTDYRQGMRDLTNHLLMLGYRRLTLVSPIRPEDVGVTAQRNFAERLAGFREAADAAGLSESQARILFHAPTVNWRDDYAPGQAVIPRLIESRERPEVLLCSNDGMAIGALAACVDAGLKVPDDLALTGFDDTTLGRYLRPPLTTVAQPTEAVAKKAVELLLKQMRGEIILTNEKLVKLPCHVVVRESCGAARRRLMDAVQ